MFNIKKDKEINEIKLHSFNIWLIFLRQFKNPLLIILLIATVISFIFGEKVSSIVIFTMMFLSVFLGFWNEYSAEKTVDDLLKKISLYTTVIRNGEKVSIPVRDVKVGDKVALYPGSIVPADMKLYSWENLELNESILTGESYPVVKNERNRFTYMGTVVNSGSGEGEVIAIGKNTRFGKISMDLSGVRPETSFQKGLKDFGFLLVRVITIMAVIIFVVNWAIGHSFVDSSLFALTIAIGLTPELLPVVVTVGLSHGAKELAKKDVIVKQLVAMEDLGNVDVLCTDKTGTLTEGKLALTTHSNLAGISDDKILELALICNSAIVHHKIFGDAIDSAIWEHAKEENFKIQRVYKKIEEEPFDYEKRLMFSVIDEDGKRTMICKGSPESIIERCKLTKKKKEELNKHFRKMLEDGQRTIALASKKISYKGNYSFTDAENLQLDGFISFMDLPKKGIKEALVDYERLGVNIKIVTGDNEIIAERVCKIIGFPYKNVIVGPDLDKMSDSELMEKAENTEIFARVTPAQKTRIILLLKKKGHTVGFLGDGINDGPALHAADVGISVNTAVDVAKDTASIVLLKKNLEVIAMGIEGGRKTFNNTIKYILMGTSSNFGNMFSAAGASFLLPFLPMTPPQILLVNFLYDISQLSIPTDNVDKEQMDKPKKWDIGFIKKYMLFFGPISSLYDFLTFGLMFFVFKARNGLFQTGWFVESLITEIMVIMVIRTARFPFYKSRPSTPLLLTTIGVTLFGVYLPYSPLASYLGFKPLPPLYFAFLIFLTLTYLGLVEFGKIYLNKKAS